MTYPIVAVIITLVAVFLGFQVWKRFTISGNIYALTSSCETLERYPAGESKRAHDRLVKMGSRALQVLRGRNEQLIAEHVVYSKALKAGPSWNPWENYGRKSDAERAYRYVIEMKQARVVDVISEIETAVRGSTQ